MPSTSFASLCQMLCVAALAGCASVGPDYQKPALKLPATWQAAQAHAGHTTTLLTWWESFKDPVLNDLLTIAEQDNPSLAQATAAIASARASQHQASANALPSFNASTSANRSGSLNANGTNPASTASSGLDASWEVDLFGSIRRNQEAASARMEARSADWHDARVSLAAEVASQYVNYRACRELEKSYRTQLESLTQTEKSSHAAVAAGLQAPADAALATASASTAAASLVNQTAECDLGIKALVALTGLDEPALRDKLKQPSPTLPEAALFEVSSVPVQLLSQRPDLVAAERSLAAASADIGAAEANRYPRLSLLGSISVASTQSSGTSKQTSSWSFGPSLSVPVFDGGSSRAQVATAQANYDSALAAYQSAVRTAVKEVEQSLVRLEAATQRQDKLATSAREYRRYFEAAEQNYHAGGISLLSLEDARRSVLQAEQNAIIVKRDRILYGIALYKALGGGWQAETNTLSSGVAP